MHWGEEVRLVVEEWRTKIGITGPASIRDARRLLEAIPGLTLRMRTGQRGRLVIDRESEKGWVIADPSLDDLPFELVLLEEVAHYLLRDLAPPSDTLSGQQRSNGKAETPAQAFVTMWRMHGLERMSDEDILAEGFGREDLSRFRALQLAG